MSLAPIGRQSEKFILRLPDGLRTLIKVRAANSRRTMNSEILVLIERALEEEKQNAAPQ